MMYILQDFGCKSEAVELKQTLSVVFDPTIASRGLQSKLSLKVQNIWAPEKIDYYPIMVLSDSNAARRCKVNGKQFRPSFRSILTWV